VEHNNENVVVSWLPGSLINNSWGYVVRNRAQRTVSNKSRAPLTILFSRECSSIQE
jgi:hypothetical protein